MQHAIPTLLQGLGLRVAAVQLGLLIFQHDLPVDDLFDLAVAMDLELHRHPLVSVIGLRA